jgi:hypothetical protein
VSTARTDKPGLPLRERECGNRAENDKTNDHRRRKRRFRKKDAKQHRKPYHPRDSTNDPYSSTTMESAVAIGSGTESIPQTIALLDGIVRAFSQRSCGCWFGIESERLHGKQSAGERDLAWTNQGVTRQAAPSRQTLVFNASAHRRSIPPGRRHPTVGSDRVPGIAPRHPPTPPDVRISHPTVERSGACSRRIWWHFHPFLVHAFCPEFRDPSSKSSTLQGHCGHSASPRLCRSGMVTVVVASRRFRPPFPALRSASP